MTQLKDIKCLYCHQTELFPKNLNSSNWFNIVERCNLCYHTYNKNGFFWLCLYIFYLINTLIFFIFLFVSAWFFKTSLLIIAIGCMAALLPILQLTRKLATILGLYAYTLFFRKNDV